MVLSGLKVEERREKLKKAKERLSNILLAFCFLCLAGVEGCKIAIDRLDFYWHKFDFRPYTGQFKLVWIGRSVLYVITAGLLLWVSEEVAEALAKVPSAAKTAALTVLMAVVYTLSSFWFLWIVFGLRHKLILGLIALAVGALQVPLALHVRNYSIKAASIKNEHERAVSEADDFISSLRE